METRQLIESIQALLEEGHDAFYIATELVTQQKEKYIQFLIDQGHTELANQINEI